MSLIKALQTCISIADVCMENSRWSLGPVSTLSVPFLCSTRCTEESASEGCTWVWNTLRTKEPLTSPTITQTALQEFVFRRSKRESSWTSSRGQEKTEICVSLILPSLILLSETLWELFSIGTSCTAKAFVYLETTFWRLACMSAHW